MADAEEQRKTITRKIRDHRSGLCGDTAGSNIGKVTGESEMVLAVGNGGIAVVSTRQEKSASNGIHLCFRLIS